MSEVIAWSTGVVSLVWLAESISSQLKPRPRPEVKKPHSWLQAWPNVTLALFVIFCVAALFFDLGTLHLDQAALLFQLPGLLLSIAATSLSLRAEVELGDQFDGSMQVWTGQQLVTKGLYSLVRHPVYLATVALWLGTGLGMLSWLLLVIGLAIMLPTFYLRCRREEQLMLDHFGLLYRSYQARVPRLFPWPRPSGQPASVDLPEMAEQPHVAEQE